MKNQNTPAHSTSSWQTLGRGDGIIEKRRRNDDHTNQLLSDYDHCVVCDEKLTLHHQMTNSQVIETASCASCGIQIRQENHQQH